ncbi:FecR family protein [Accumulibacter sp.]|uniref:FecR family protein n=1 Tax=Accumulibacter sp. TaxID=2053492 RepID=UPI0025DB3A58|nr:FecR family protein [Accumulibacter sp.]MCM8613268.1 FecR family protein [Accumulibacter sp.]MCM8636932.1 FecR family protein [Accumulibacter sp.]MCM8638920.1 FecR family protein [Accumulibacter sp.]
MNRSRLHALVACGLLAGALTSIAAPSGSGSGSDAVVAGVLMPAWLERQGSRQELRAGIALQNRDRLLTGANARVEVRLRDGSVLRLAADTHCELNALGVREPEVFTAAIDVPQGAVRFTTGHLARSLQQRAVNLRVGTLTASVRGTDLWGTADGAGDRICLLEGRITLLQPDNEARQVSEEGSCYLAAKDGSPAVLQTVTAAQLAWSAAQTGMPPAAATASPAATASRPARTTRTARRGSWSVEVAAVDGEAEALAIHDRARAAGHGVRIRPLPAAGGGYRYALRLGPLSSEAEAAALAAEIGNALSPAPVSLVRN